MKRNFSSKFVWTLSLVVMLLWLASNGCKGRTSPSEQTSSAQINVSSRQIANGNVVLNNISEQTVSIQNTGSSSLNIGQIAQANSLAPPFSIVSDACSGQAVQPSSACSFNVQFSPTSQATFTQSFDIPSNASNENSVTVEVTGSGKALRAVISQVNTAGCYTGELELIVTVTDQNVPVAGLLAGNFQLKENGVSQQTFTVSQDLTPVPISVAMLLDYTNSILSQISNIEAASKSFVGLLTVNDEASIIKFAEMQQQMCSFTANTSVLIEAINTAPSPSLIGNQGVTKLYDALWFAVEKTAVEPNNKAIVVVSDGKDEDYTGAQNVSLRTLDEVIAYATVNHVAIYTVGLGSSVNSSVMNSLASETGGQSYYITSADQLTGVYQAISDIFLGQYSIRYVSSLHGSSLITLEINVVGANTNEGVGVWQGVGCP